MKFFRAVWKLVVGIKDVLVLVVMLLFFGLLYSLLSARPQPIRDGVLDVALTGTVVEQPERRGWADVAGRSPIAQYALRDVVRALDNAKSDDRVKAVALDLDSFTGGGQSAMIEVAEAVRRVRSSGKPVIAYATGYTDDSYQVAAAASQVWLNPLGAVLITGPGGSNLYFKGLLDKLGVTANVYRAGTYKSAVEPFIRGDMSPQARENAQSLADAELEHWAEAVRKSRPQARVDVYLKDMNAAVAAAGGDMAKAALQAGLVDKIADRQALEAELARLGGGEGSSGSPYKRIALPSYVRDIEPSSKGAPIGIVTIAGMIVDGEAGAGTAGAETIVKEVERALDHGVKALVVRVDSPGGSVTASERIRQSLNAAKATGVPVVVSMGNVAASGGYWVSMPADFIYAEPSTITGSIGVFGVIPSFEGTLRKLGIGADGVKTSPLSGEPDLLRGISPQAGQLIQTSIEATYRRFLAIVAEARHRSPAQIDAIAQGRVWDGGSARQLGLVDGFGGLNEAVAKAASLAKLQRNAAVRYYEPPVSLEEMIAETIAGDDRSSGGSSDAVTILARRQQQAAADVVRQAQVLDRPAIQALCLECASAMPGPRLAGRHGLVAGLAALFGL